ncbi:phosphoribosyltransferase family protein [Pararhizobium sp. LjRoot235]|uniref:phosphoribosyltransferase n=1 Tax=Pararhizobium sp. LjRoot235 TaxID=3342291 RepID=UPI003ECE9AB0
MDLWLGKRLLQLSWEEFGRSVDILCERICQDAVKPDAVVALARGGLPLAAALSHRLELRDLRVISVTRNAGDERYAERKAPKIAWVAPAKDDWSARHLLICDDIAGDGGTLSVTVRRLRGLGAKSIRSATVVCNVNCQNRPDYWAVESDDWVVFPWESQKAVMEGPVERLAAPSSPGGRRVDEVPVRG